MQPISIVPNNQDTRSTKLSYTRRGMIMKKDPLKEKIVELLYRFAYSDKGKGPVHRALRDRLIQRRYDKNKQTKTVPLERLQFAMHLVDHCNLNCIGCDHFAPLSDPWYADLHHTESDLIRLRELFSERCSYIHLMGGEPLLHPQINDHIRLMRKYFPDTTLCIVTNGTLLPQMPEDFFQTCLDEKVQISISRYPISFDYVGILKSLTDRGIDAYFNCGPTKTMYVNPLSKQADQDGLDSFILCHRSNKCITLRDGKLYTCTLIPVIHILNHEFGTDYKVTSQDYVDLRTATSEKEILAQLARPTNFCRYCKLRDAKYGIPWQPSKRVPEEWIADT